MFKDVAMTAAGLSLAQRNAVLAMMPGEPRDYGDTHGRVRDALFAAGLLRFAQKQPSLLCELTPLGTKVREHLRKEQG